MATNQREISPGAAAVAAFLCGALVGAAVALLVAPQSGRETREQLTRYGREGRERLGRLADRASDVVDHAVERGREIVDERKGWGTGHVTDKHVSG